MRSRRRWAVLGRCGRAAILLMVALFLWRSDLAALAQPQLGGALVLDGVDDFAEAADHPALDLAGGSFTVEAWVNFGRLLWEEVFMKAGAYGLHVEHTYSYPRWNDGMGIDYPCLKVCVTSSRYLSTGWHHVALVYDATAGQARAYYDGVQRCACDCTPQDSSQPLWVGQGLTRDALQGAIGEFRISNVARYAGTFTPPLEPFTCDEATVALWHFDECDGATVFQDICGPTHHLLVGQNGAHVAGSCPYRMYAPTVRKEHVE